MSSSSGLSPLDAGDLGAATITELEVLALSTPVSSAAVAIAELEVLALVRCAPRSTVYGQPET